MLLKRIEGPTIEQALERVRAECGADALVVETRPTRRGFLVVAARPEAALAPVDQAGRPTRRDTGGWTRGFRPPARQAAAFGLSDRILAAIERALLGTRVDLSRPGDPALPNLCARVLQALIAAEARIEARPAPAGFRAIALVGATGVGKTTTLAKLAARAVR